MIGGVPVVALASTLAVLCVVCFLGGAVFMRRAPGRILQDALRERDRILASQKHADRVALDASERLVAVAEQQLQKALEVHQAAAVVGSLGLELLRRLERGVDASDLMFTKRRLAAALRQLESARLDLVESAEAERGS